MNTKTVNGGYVQNMERMDKYQALSFENNLVWTTSQYLCMKCIKPRSKILDYGCGRGTLKRDGKGFGEVILWGTQMYIEGLDDFDKNNPYARYHDLKDVPTDYDYILLSHVLEHYEPDGVQNILKWCAGHCSKGIMIALPHNANPLVNFWRDSSHNRPYDDMPETYIWIEDAGFKIDRVVRSTLSGRWYQKFSRLVAGKLIGFNPLDEFIIVASK